jgi:hypothetical protein
MFHRAVHDPATVTAMLEDYRAGVGIDSADDEADPAAGRCVTNPMAEKSPDEPAVALITLLRVR